jgi:hypothetical protein
MRLRAAVPSLLALSLLTAIPAHATAGCGKVTDPAGDVPVASLDITGAQVAVVKIPKKPKATPNVEITLFLASTDASGNPAGASYYVDFRVNGRDYSVWRHVAPLGTNPDVYGGRSLVTPHRTTATSITWVVPLTKIVGMKTGNDACALRGYVQVANGIVTPDST